MKKSLAILLALAMLLSTCAWAEGARLRLKDMQIYEDGEVTADLTGFCAELAAATIGEGDSGIRLYCSEDGRGLLNVTFGEADGETVFGYGAGDGFEKCYRIPASVPLHDAIAGLNLTRRGDWSLVDALADVIPADCQREGGVVDYGGEECEATMFEFSEDYVNSLLQFLSMLASFQPDVRKALNAAGFDSLMDAIGTANLRLSILGELYRGANTDAVDLTVSARVQQYPLEVALCVEHAPVANGHVFGVSARIGAEGDDVAFTAEVEAVMDGDAAWLPLDVSGAEELNSSLTDVSGILKEILQGKDGLMNVLGEGLANGLMGG